MVTIQEVSSFQFSGIGSKLGTLAATIGIIILVGIVLGLISWFLISYFKNNKRVKVFKKIGNVPTCVGSWKARSERLGNAGDYLFFIPRLKKVLPEPNLQMGRNEYWFYIREDGEWINFSLGDMDDQMQKAKTYYVHEDMRLQRLGIQKNLRDRLQKESIWQKYGQQIMMAGFVVIITVCLIVLFKNMTGVWGAGASAAKSTTEMATAVKGMADAVSNFYSHTASGAVPVASPVGG